MSFDDKIDLIVGGFFMSVSLLNPLLLMAAGFRAWLAFTGLLIASAGLFIGYNRITTGKWLP